MNTLAYFIFGIGWPVLIIGSIWLWRNMDHLDHAAKTFLNVSLASFYLLGYVSTLFWMGQPWYLGILPAFAIFLVLFVITLRTAYVKEHSGQGDMEVHA
jgi:CHASE2 domain-containing sensor protein